MNNHTSSLDSSHFPVMLNEIIKISTPSKGGTYIECTFGGGNYSKTLLLVSINIIVILISILVFMIILNLISNSYLNLVISILGIIELSIVFMIYHLIRKKFYARL